MSLYVSDGDIKFGWKSFGRSFAAFGALALAVATAGFLVMHASWAHSLDPGGQLLATAAEWIGGALVILLAYAAWGSLQISCNERGDVEITTEGVRRIFAPGKADFLPLEQIVGLMGRPFGGVLLIDRTGRRDMIIPRSIEGYRDCIAELKAMGIIPLPADRRRVWGRRKRTWLENLSLYAMGALGCIYGGRGLPPLVHHMVGALIVAGFLVTVVLETQRDGRFRWRVCLIGSILIAALLWWRW